MKIWNTYHARTYVVSMYVCTGEAVYRRNEIISYESKSFEVMSPATGWHLENISVQYEQKLGVDNVFSF